MRVRGISFLGALVLGALAAVAWAGRDVHIPNPPCPTGAGDQGGRSTPNNNAGGNLVIEALSPTDKDTSIHIWWYIYTPGENGSIPPTGGENGHAEERSKDHDKKQKCTATIYVPPGKSVHWVVAYDKWNKDTAEEKWTWATEGTAAF